MDDLEVIPGPCPLTGEQRDDSWEGNRAFFSKDACRIFNLYRCDFPGKCTFESTKQCLYHKDPNSHRLWLTASGQKLNIPDHTTKTREGKSFFETRERADCMET